MANGSPQLECITPLRMLLRKEREPALWDAEVRDMEAHTEIRQVEADWQNEHINVVEFLRRKCNLADRYVMYFISILEIALS